jgi:hypothetical protein
MKFLHLLLLGAFNLCGIDQCQSATPDEQAAMQAAVQDAIHPVWLTQKWDAKENAPYVAKAAEIERLLQLNVSASTLLKRYESTARAKPKDSLALFPWVYARYRLVESGRIKKPHTSFGLESICEDLYKVLVMAPPPPSAEYARLRFKIEYRTHLRSRLKGVGARLVALYPNDRRLLLAYNGVIADSGDLGTAVRNGYLLVKKYPKDPGCRYNLATDLTSLAWNKRDPRFLDAGEAQFKMFEKLAPGNHRLRRSLPDEREYIRRTRLRLMGKTP